ncbi:MAG: hypothetical protein ACETWD_01920 [Desulfatiglandales bacterium]
MLRLFNSLGKRIETFRPADEKVVNIFTCGPSVYQRSHIGNFRTFLFEDILLRYLEYSGYTVKRGMNFTDIEDKAIKEAKNRGQSVTHLTEENIRRFLEEMDLLNIKIPDYLPKASDAIHEAVEIIDCLLDLKVAYRYRGSVYFDPLKFPGFGELYGVDMANWPAKRGDFIGIRIQECVGTWGILSSGMDMRGVMHFTGKQGLERAGLLGTFRIQV